MSDWYVYIISSSDERLYTGISTDPERRFSQHQGVKPGGARFFRGRTPVAIVYTERVVDRSAALKREASIKKLSRQEKIMLIADGGNNA